jgi:hypothetical protein
MKSAFWGNTDNAAVRTVRIPEKGDYFRNAESELAGVHHMLYNNVMREGT